MASMVSGEIIAHFGHKQVKLSPIKLIFSTRTMESSGWKTLNSLRVSAVLTWLSTERIGRCPGMTSKMIYRTLKTDTTSLLLNQVNSILKFNSILKECIQ
jgi:hypothetical protein